MKVTTHFSTSDITREYTAIIIGGTHDGKEYTISNKRLPTLQIGKETYHNTNTTDQVNRLVFVP